MIAIIDYDAGNIKSVEKALLSLGQEVTVTAKQDEILGADKIVLPGVGAFGDAMENLRKRQLDAVIREAVEKEIPFLGICLGLQALFEKIEEEYDLAVFDDAYDEYKKSGEESRPISDFWKELDI